MKATLLITILSLSSCSIIKQHNDKRLLARQQEMTIEEVVEWIKNHKQFKSK